MASPYYAVGRYTRKAVAQALGESSTGKPQAVSCRLPRTF